MTDPRWKPGDWAMVQLFAFLGRNPDTWWLKSNKGEGMEGTILASALHPLPPSLTPEAQAVLDAARAWRALTNKPYTAVEYTRICDSLSRAIDEWEATLAPSLTPEDKKVLDAADVWENALASNATTDEYADAVDELSAAIRARRATLAPPDPVKNLRRAWTKFINTKGLVDDSEMEAAIAALEKKP